MKTHPLLWSSIAKIDGLRFQTNGKGMSEELSTASALSEMMERISGGMETSINLVSPFRQLEGEKAKLLSDVMAYKYVKGYKWMHQDCVKNVVKVEHFLHRYKFEKEVIEKLKIESKLLRHWIPGYSLVNNENVYVPITFVKWISSTNGLASGNTIEEAIIHGACEIFERNALIHFLKFGIKDEYPTLDNNTINNEYICEILAFFEENGVQVVIKDIGMGLYPVFAIMTFNKNLNEGEIGYNTIKAGSSFNSDEAILRALTERMQGTSLSYESRLGTRPTGTPTTGFMPLFFKGICPISLSEYRHGKLEAYRKMELNGTKEEINECINIVKNLGLDLIVINHTHPVLNFPTVRVIIPGISDFMSWWDSKIETDIKLIGNLEPEEDAYEEKLATILKSFKPSSIIGSAAKNSSRRDK